MNENNPTASVIIPCYNQGQYLDEAVESVLAQTYQNFEIIVINDGSTDAETIQILSHYEKPKLKLIHTENRGPSAARNTAIEHASGELILPLDADDRIEKTYLEKAIKTLEGNPDVGVVYCEAEFFGAETGKWELPDIQFPEILLGNRLFNTSLYRRADWETVGGYKENMVHGWEDYDFWLSLFELGRKVVRIPEVLFFYRRVQGSRDKQMTREQRVQCFAQIYHNHPRLYSENIGFIFKHILEQSEGLDFLKAQAQYLQSAFKQSQTELHRSQTELYQTQTELGKAYRSLEGAQDFLQQTQAVLGQTQAVLVQTQVELERSQAASRQLQFVIEAMQTSKFWKAREKWFRLKRRLGLPAEDTL